MYDAYTTPVLPFLLGEQLSVPSFEKGGSEKMTVWANLKSFCHAEYLPRGLAIFLVKKDFQRSNMALSSISNVDLGLF